MNQIKTGESGGQPFTTNRSLPHLQDSILLGFRALGSCFLVPRQVFVDVNQLGFYGFVIDGCVISGSGPYANTAGTLWLDGEVYAVDAASGVTGSGNLFWHVLETYLPTDPVLFHDSTTHSVHKVRKAELVYTTPSPGDIGVTYFYALSIFNVAKTLINFLARNKQDDWHVVDDPGEPAFQNSWSYASNKVKFVLERTMNYNLSRVTITGTLSKGSPAVADELIFTLPVGYRPNERWYIPLKVTTDGNNRSIYIDPDGSVKYSGVATTPSTIELAGQVQIIVPSA